MKFWTYIKTNHELIGTISTIVISLAALAVAVLTAQYTNLQASVTKAQNAPVLKFNIEDSGKGVESLTVINIGGPAIEFKMDTQTFIKVKYLTNDYKEKEELIPLDGYFYVSAPTHDVKDVLISQYTNIYFSQPNSGIKAKKIIMEFNKQMAKSGRYTIAELAHLCKISYSDIFKESHNGSYVVTEFERKRLDKQGVEKLTSTLAAKKRMNADNITLDQFFSAIPEIKQ